MEKESSESSVSKQIRTSTDLFNFRAFLSVFKIKVCVEIFYTTDSFRPIHRLLKGSFLGGGSFRHHVTTSYDFTRSFPNRIPCITEGQNLNS